jgi:tetratricopeptide (TPR) repeat protein
MKQNWEQAICNSMDLMADGKYPESESVLNDCITDIKKEIAARGDSVEALYAWGMCLSIMEEHEQALLKFEGVLKKDPDHKDAWWRTATTLFYHLEEAESAKRILEEKLIKLYPDEQEYVDALVDVTSYLKRASQVSKGIEGIPEVKEEKS